MPPYTFTDRYPPEYEVTRRVVELLRADVTLCSSVVGSEGLMYQLTPRLMVGDDRVYSAYVELPENSQLRSALPRIHVETRQDEFMTEQIDAAVPAASVTIWVNTIVPADREQLGEQIDARLRVVLMSTGLTSARILASGITVDAERRQKVREAALGGVWRITSVFRSRLVGVLQ